MMNKLQINLSSRPFANHSLYHLAYVVLGVAGLLLLVHNGLWFFTNHGDVRSMEDEITQLQAEVDSNIVETRALANEIDQIQRNRRFREVVNFVDGRIRQRRFSWIRMLNLLQEALPANVKIESITPRVQPDSIRITLACMARRESAVNEFIEHLEDIEEFDQVLITSEDREGGTITFPLTMEYSPLGFNGDRGADEAIAEVTDAGGRKQDTEPPPEPGSLAEWVSRAELPDPEMAQLEGMEFPLVEISPDEEVSDPFAIEGADPFAAGGDIFGDTGGLGMGMPAETGIDAAGDPPPETGSQKKRSSGAMIKRPPRKPGRRPGDRS